MSVFELGNGTSLEALAGLHERFEVLNRNFCEMHNKFDVEFEEMEDLVEKALEAQKLADIALSATSHARYTYHRLAKAFDEVEIELNEGPGRIQQLVLATATATSSVSKCTVDLADGEHKCFCAIVRCGWTFP